MTLVKFVWFDDYQFFFMANTETHLQGAKRRRRKL